MDWPTLCEKRSPPIGGKRFRPQIKNHGAQRESGQRRAAASHRHYLGLIPLADPDCFQIEPGRKDMAVIANYTPDEA